VKPAGAANGFGPEVGGLASRITLPKEKFTVGEAIPVTYVIKNVSKDEKSVWDCGFWHNHLILVKNAEGKQEWVTEGEGLKIFAFDLRGPEEFKRFGLEPRGDRAKDVRVPIKPGAEDSAYEKYDLTRFYGLTEPGHYTVQYIYQNEGPESRLPSNTVMFEIVAK
jgi:hypothetical protein